MLWLLAIRTLSNFWWHSLITITRQPNSVKSTSLPWWSMQQSTAGWACFLCCPPSQVFFLLSAYAAHSRMWCDTHWHCTDMSLLACTHQYNDFYLQLIDCLCPIPSVQHQLSLALTRISGRRCCYGLYAPASYRHDFQCRSELKSENCIYLQLVPGHHLLSQQWSMAISLWLCGYVRMASRQLLQPSILQ